MTKAFVFSKAKDAVYSQVVNYLTSKGIEVLDSPTGAEFTIVLGGDGTVLAASRLNIPNPVLVINTGHLGFLSSAEPASAGDESYIAAIDAVLAGEYTTTDRHMLEIKLIENGRSQQVYYALNDVVIAKATMAKLIKLGVYVSNKGSKQLDLLSEYRADGLIVSTPTGSSAYTVAAGGPIIHPAVPCYAITPICPQGLTQRSVVIAPNLKITIKPLEGNLYMSIDGQIEASLGYGYVEVTYNNHVVKTINPTGTYYEVLRRKLSWGVR